MNSQVMKNVDDFKVNQKLIPIVALYNKCQQQFGKVPSKNVECRSGKGILTQITISLFTPWGMFQAAGRTRKDAHMEVCRVALASPMPEVSIS